MAYRGAENVGTHITCVGPRRRCAMCPSGYRQSLRDVTVEIVCDGSAECVQ